MFQAFVYTAQGISLNSTTHGFSILSLRTSDSLDEIGTFSFTMSATGVDPSLSSAQAAWVQQLKQKRRVSIEWYNPVRNERYEVANGFIERRTYDRASRTYTLDCVDLLDEWTRQPVGLNRRIDVDPFADVMSTFAGEITVPDNALAWSVTTDISTDNVVGMLAGVSYFAAAIETCRRFKYHLRRKKALGRVVEAGELGVTSGVRIVHTVDATPLLEGRTDIAILGRLRIIETSSALVNRIIALGGSVGQSQLSLKGYGGDGDYPVQQLTRGGKALYYIEDATSIGEYGLHEQILAFSGITLQGSSNADAQNAKAQLHRQAKSYLQLSREPQVVYELSVENLPDAVQVGDTLHLIYHGDADIKDPFSGSIVGGDIADVDADLFVVSLNKTWRAEGGVSYDIRVSNLDRPPLSSLGIHVSQVSQAEVYRTLANPVRKQWTGSASATTDQLTGVNGSQPPLVAKCEIEFNDKVLILHSAILYIETDYGTASSEDILFNGTVRPTYGVPYYLSFFINDQDIGDYNAIDENTGTNGIDALSITTEYASKTVLGTAGRIWGEPETPQQFKFDITNFLKNEDGSVDRKHVIEVYNANAGILGSGDRVLPETDLPSLGAVRFSYILEVTTKEDVED